MYQLVLQSCGPLAQWILLDQSKQYVDDLCSQEKNDSSAQLLPLLHALLSKNTVNLKDIHIIYFFNGPGSFTGLRIGASTLKALNFVHTHITIKQMQLLHCYAWTCLQQKKLDTQFENTVTLYSILPSRRQYLYFAEYEAQNLQNNKLSEALNNSIVETKVEDFLQNHLSAEATIFDMYNVLDQHEHNKQINVYKQALSPHNISDYVQVFAEHFDALDTATFQPQYIVKSVAKPNPKTKAMA